jgi:hypothetical protein
MHEDAQSSIPAIVTEGTIADIGLSADGAVMSVYGTITCILHEAGRASARVCVTGEIEDNSVEIPLAAFHTLEPTDSGGLCGEHEFGNGLLFMSFEAAPTSYSLGTSDSR